MLKTRYQKLSDEELRSILDKPEENDEENLEAARIILAERKGEDFDE